jgi:hypothetical protein
MSDTGVEVNTKNVELLFKNAPRALKRELANGLDHISRKFYKDFKNERLSGSPGVQSRLGGIFHRFRRIVTTAKGEERNASVKTIQKSYRNPLDMQVEMYTMSVVAGKYETGGDISAAGGLMRIPLSPEAKQRGDKNPILGLSPVKTAKGLFLVQKLGKDNMIFHYILKHSVPIRRKLGFYQTWGDMDSDRVQILNNAIDIAFSKV